MTVNGAKCSFAGVDARADQRMAKYIRENFSRKECTVFVPKATSFTRKGAGPSGSYCYCGAAAEEHSKVEENPGEWNEETCIKEFPTDAYGRLRFTSSDFASAQSIKYVRLSNTTDPQLVLELIAKYWRMIEVQEGIEDPQLILSVVGGGRMFQLADNFQKKLFNRELMRAVNTTNGWLLTSGLHAGVAHAVGDALRENQSFIWRDEIGKFKSKICCIGIVPWGGIFGSNRLVTSNPEIMADVNYPVFAPNTRLRFKGRLPLNPYHTHFIMVDDGYRNQERGVAEFRAKFERHISLPVDEGGLGIPVVQILIEGAANALEVVAKTVTEGTPVLVCEGTGRAADMLAQCCRLYSRIHRTPDSTAREFKLEAFKRTLRDRIINSLYSDHVPDDPEERYDRCVRAVLQICEKRQMVTIFNVKRGNALDTAILSCLMDRTHHTEKSSQLNLALKWNRIDVAKEKIFGATTATEATLDLWPFFKQALLTDRPEFVRLFIDYGLDVKSSLTVQDLTDLYSYSAAEPHTLFWRLLKLDNGNVLQKAVSLRDVYEVIKGITRWFQHPLYSKEHDDESLKNTFEEPFNELFLWAVLINNEILAIRFWECCEEPLLMSIIGTMLCQSLASNVVSITGNFREPLRSLKQRLEQLAIQLAEKAYAVDVEQTMLLLHRRQTKWGNFTCMELAATAKDQAFLSSDPCQYAIRKTWTRGYEASGWAITVAAFTVFPVLLIIRFDQEHIEHSPRRDPRYSVVLSGDTSGRRPTAIPEVIDGTMTSKQLEEATHDKEGKRFWFTGSEEELSFLAPLRAGISAWTKYITFYTSPSVKFACHTLSYIFYLILYAYVILFDFRFRPTSSEIFLHFWTFTLLCEQIRMIIWYPSDSFKHKLHEWWGYSSMALWNRLDFLMLFLAVVAFTLRWHSSTFDAARLVLSTNYITCLFRLFKIYFVNSYLGPKVVMLKRMAFDLAMFLLILVIILLSYTIVSHALLFPHRDYYKTIGWNLLYHGVWVLFGEVQSELDRATNPVCVIPGNETQVVDCGGHTFPPQVLLAAYCFFGNILLVNMLIATFTNVFEAVQRNSVNLSKYLMYFVMKEYNDKPSIPPPFIIIEHAYLVLNRCHRSRLFGGKASADLVWGRVLTERNYRFLSVFEKTIRSDLIEENEKGDEKQLEKLIPEMNEKLNRLMTKIKAMKAEAAASQREMLKRKGAFVPRTLSMVASRRGTQFRSTGQIVPDSARDNGAGDSFPMIDEDDGEAWFGGFDFDFDEDEDDDEKGSGILENVS